MRLETYSSFFSLVGTETFCNTRLILLLGLFSIQAASRGCSVFKHLCVIACTVGYSGADYPEWGLTKVSFLWLSTLPFHFFTNQQFKQVKVKFKPDSTIMYMELCLFIYLPFKFYPSACSLIVNILPLLLEAPVSILYREPAINSEICIQHFM